MRAAYAIVLLGLLATLTWRSGHCQYLHKLDQKLAEKQAFEEVLDEYGDQMRDSMDVMNNLWTVYLPQLLERPSSFEELDEGISEACINSTLSILNNKESFLPNISLPELVLLLDATGKQGAGLLAGNLYLRGAFDECFKYNYTGYCLAHVGLSFIPPTLPFSWTAGLCVPKYCTAEDMEKIIESTEVIVVKKELGGIRCENSKALEYSGGAIAMLCVCGVFIALVAVGSLIDILTDQVPSFLRNADTKEQLTESTPILAQKRSEKKQPKCLSKTLEFITAFSLYKTVPTLLATKQAPGVITSLNGLRVISMFWVILGHTHLLALSNIDNTSYLKDFTSRLSHQVITNGFFSVDSFFFLSGVLVAYLSLRQMKKKKGRFPFLHYYIHRYLRLTPVYAFVLFFTWALAKHLAYAPGVSLTDSVAGKCSQYWWTNLLYINNLYPWSLSDECIGWTWYLANDMQFYIISPLILIPLYYLFPVGLAIAGVILMCGFFITAVTAGIYDFQASPLAPIAYGYTPNPNITQNYTDMEYVKPWARIAPYIVGLLLGYVFYKGIRLSFNRITNSVLYLGIWLASGMILLPTLFGLVFTWHGHIPTQAENVIYITFSRFAWGVGLALMVFACHNGYGWVINSFLSMPMWTPLSRMSFNAYLVHLVVMHTVFGQLQTSIHYGDITMAMIVVGVTVLSFGIAAILCLFVEFPLGTIEMLVFNLIGLKSRKSQRQITKERKDDEDDDEGDNEEEDADGKKLLSIQALDKNEKA